ncbi:hypothetical protein KSP39_PZI023619 [Platanthera zijinensis]|uniref:Uncharacterized protein n=1 Tax=Platanthera zijinensis TaxID=2320716 RepID=A0AAP0FUB2_9ASPA
MRVKRLPSTSKHFGTFSGSEVCISVGEQNIDGFVAWVVQFIQKMLVLKSQDILADLSIEHMDNQGSKHEYLLPKTEEPFPVPASLPVSNIESMRSGLESYIMKHGGSMKIACSTRRYEGWSRACKQLRDCYKRRPSF